MVKKIMSIIAIACLTTVMACKGHHHILKNPYSNNDSNPVIISGKVTKGYSNSFDLSYGEGGKIKVEMKDWSFKEGPMEIKPGEKVTVYGYVDETLFKQQKIEARTIYAHNHNAYYFADSDKDGEESSYGFFTTKVDIEKIPSDAQVNIRGEITKVSGKKFVLKIGSDEIVVNTKTLPYDPFNSKDRRKIGVGDNVYVSGKMKSGFFSKAQLKADYIIETGILKRNLGI